MRVKVAAPKVECRWRCRPASSFSPGVFLFRCARPSRPATPRGGGGGRRRGGAGGGNVWRRLSTLNRSRPLAASRAARHIDIVVGGRERVCRASFSAFLNNSAPLFLVSTQLLFSIRCALSSSFFQIVRFFIAKTFASFDETKNKRETDNKRTRDFLVLLFARHAANVKFKVNWRTAAAKFRQPLPSERRRGR